MQLKLPDRPIRFDAWLEANSDYPYYDHQTVVQEDGRIAAFSGNSRARDKGWVLQGWKDSQHFWLLEGDEQTGVMAQLLLDSTEAKNEARREAWLAKEAARPKLSPEESSASFGKFVFPVIESVVANGSILSSLSDVQPMTGPVSPTLKLEIVTEPYKPEPDPTVADDEELHAYKYGGVLSERGGWFVTKKGDPTRVLRYRMDWMS